MLSLLFFHCNYWFRHSRSDRRAFVLQHTVIVTARRLCLLALVTATLNALRWPSSEADMTSVNKEQQATRWHISSWEVILATHAPLSSRSSFLPLLSTSNGLKRGEGGEEVRKSGWRGEGEQMRVRNEQCREVSWPQILVQLSEWRCTGCVAWTVEPKYWLLAGEDRLHVWI